MKLLSIIVDELPKNCLGCPFNRDKYCAVKIAFGSNDCFVQNNRQSPPKDCPLTPLEKT